MASAPADEIDETDALLEIRIDPGHVSDPLLRTTISSEVIDQRHTADAPELFGCTPDNHLHQGEGGIRDLYLPGGDLNSPPSLSTASVPRAPTPWAAQSISVASRSKRVAKRLDSSIPTGDRHLDAFSRTGVFLQWRWRTHIGLAIDNLFNERQVPPIGSLAPNRSVRFRRRLQLSSCVGGTGQLRPDPGQQLRVRKIHHVHKILCKDFVGMK